QPAGIVRVVGYAALPTERELERAIEGRHCCFLQARTKSSTCWMSSERSECDTKCAPTATRPRARVATVAVTSPVFQAGNRATPSPTRTAKVPRTDWTTRFMVPLLLECPDEHLNDGKIALGALHVLDDAGRLVQDQRAEHDGRSRKPVRELLHLREQRGDRIDPAGGRNQEQEQQLTKKATEERRAAHFLVWTHERAKEPGDEVQQHEDEDRHPQAGGARAEEYGERTADPTDDGSLVHRRGCGHSLDEGSRCLLQRAPDCQEHRSPRERCVHARVPHRLAASAGVLRSIASRASSIASRPSSSISRRFCAAGMFGSRSMIARWARS